VILAKMVIRRFLRFHGVKYSGARLYWQHFEIVKDFKILVKKEHGLK